MDGDCCFQGQDCTLMLSCISLFKNVIFCYKLFGKAHHVSEDNILLSYTKQLTILTLSLTLLILFLFSSLFCEDQTSSYSFLCNITIETQSNNYQRITNLWVACWKSNATVSLGIADLSRFLSWQYLTFIPAPLWNIIRKGIRSEKPHVIILKSPDCCAPGCIESISALSVL